MKAVEVKERRLLETTESFAAHLGGTIMKVVQWLT